MTRVVVSSFILPRSSFLWGFVMLSRALGRAAGLLAAGLLGVVRAAGAAPPPAEEVCPLASPVVAQPDSLPEELRLPGEVPSAAKPPAQAPRPPVVEEGKDPEPAPNRQGGLDLLAPPQVPVRWGSRFGDRPAPSTPVARPATPRAPTPVLPVRRTYEERPAPKRTPEPAPLPAFTTHRPYQEQPDPILTPAPVTAIPSTDPDEAVPVLPRSSSAAPSPVTAADCEKMLDLPPGMLPPVYPSRKWPPAHDVRSTSGAYVSTGQVLIEEASPSKRALNPAELPRMPKPARAPAAVLAPPREPPPIVDQPLVDRPRSRPAVGSVTTGTLFIEEAPPSPRAAPASATPVVAGRPAAPPPAADSAMVQAWELKRRLRAACGETAQEVLVVQQPDHTLLVKVRVEDAAMQQRATDAILRLPEMANPQVRLQIDVAH